MNTVTAGSGTFETLKATAIIDSSVKPSQVVYDKPRTLSFKTDKRLKKAKVALVQDKTPIPFTQKIDGTTLTLYMSNDLAREKSYNLTITDVESIDGSTLSEPYNMSF